MAAFIIDQGATVLCGHGGTCTPITVAPRVKANGMPVTTQPSPWSVAGCPLSSSGSTFCVTIQWTSGASRVTAGGQPVLLQTSSGTSPETGSSASVVMTQTRVNAT